MMAAVFGAQGIGILAAALVSLAVVGGYDNTRVAHVDASWRLLIGLGCVPAVVGLYFRYDDYFVIFAQEHTCLRHT